MKLNKITLVLLASLLCFACQKDEPVAPNGGNEPEPVVPVELNNQYAIDENIKPIGSVVTYEVEGMQVFALYEQEGITETSDETKPSIEIHIAPASLGQSLDLATATAEEVSITAESVDTEALTGTLEITVDETQEKVTIVLESENADKVQLRAHYDSAFATHVILNNQYLLNDVIKSIGSVVKYDYDTWTVFALYEQEGITDVATTAPIELYIAPSSLNKVIDLATIAPEEVFISMQGITQPSGTLEVVWDETQETVTILLNAKENDTLLKAHYNGKVSSYVELNNQYLVNGEINPINSVVMLEVEGGYQFGVYEQANVSDFSTTPAIELFIATASMGQKLDLATLTAEQATLSLAGTEVSQLTGTLKVNFAEKGKPFAIELEAKNQEGTPLRANYSGEYATTYVAQNPHFTVNETAYGAITSVLRKTEGGKTNFAFADNSATTAEACLNAHVGVWFALTPYKGEIDASQATSFIFIDYDNNKVYDSSNSNIKEGTITTLQATDGKVYISMNVTLDNGIVIDAEYFGEATDVTDLTAMLPAKEYGFYYYNSDGTEATSAVINKVTCKTNYSGMLEITFGNTDSNVANLVSTWPKLTISPDLVNQGVIDCSNLPNNSFSIRYGDFQIDAPSGTSKDKYVHLANNGTLEVSKDDAGNYKISFDMKNKYLKYVESDDAYVEQGDNSRLVITYEGAVIEQ